MRHINFTYVILQERVLLAKKKYNNWREVQQEFYDEFMTSLGPFFLEDFIEYLEDDFKEEENWPFSKQDLISFINSNTLILEGR